MSFLTFISSACADPAASVPSLPAVETSPAASAPTDPSVLLVDDFSDGDLINFIGGESGAWSLDPNDMESECTPSVVQVDVSGQPNSVLRLDYRLGQNRFSQNGYWTKLRNADVTAFDHLEFDVKGDPDKGFTTSFIVQIKKYKDPETRKEKISGNYRVENVTGEWQTIRIPLNVMTGVLDFADPEVWKNPVVSFKNLDEFVIVFHNRHVSQTTGTIYLDNIKFIRTGSPGPTAVDFPPRSTEKTPTRIEGLEFAKFLISRLRGFPSRLVLEKQFPEDDRQLFYEVAKDTWKFFDNIVDKEHHLPLDQVHMGKEAPASEGVWIGDYTNITNIGVYLMVLVSALDFGFIPREEALTRLKATLDKMESLEHHGSGFFYNYYDTTTLEKTSYFVSFVDSAWVAAGLYVVKNAFPDELGAPCARMLKLHNFRFFFDPVEEQMFHGYYGNLSAFSNYHYGAFYSESRAGSLIAVAQGDVPAEHWFRTERVFPESYDWQRSRPIARVKKEVRGISYYGGFYEWSGLRFVPSWGGSAFEAMMPQLVLNEKELAPEGLGKNGEMHVRGQIMYARDELGYPVWGMSPSAVPDGAYGEFGVGPMGSKGYPAGVVTPHASILGVEYAPKEVAQNIRELVKRYPVYGEYGFYDAVSIETGHVAQRYLCLDQGMIFVALANYLNNGAIRKRFHQDPVIKGAEYLLREEKLFVPLEDAAGSGGDSGVIMRPVKEIQKTDDRSQKTDDRSQKTEDRTKQLTENG